MRYGGYGVMLVEELAWKRLMGKSMGRMMVETRRFDVVVVLGEDVVRAVCGQPPELR
jgi:hypothetical protein